MCPTHTHTHTHIHVQICPYSCNTPTLHTHIHTHSAQSIHMHSHRSHSHSCMFMYKHACTHVYEHTDINLHWCLLCVRPKLHVYTFTVMIALEQLPLLTPTHREVSHRGKVTPSKPRRKDMVQSELRDCWCEPRVWLLSSTFSPKFYGMRKGRHQGEGWPRLRTHLPAGLGTWRRESVHHNPPRSYPVTNTRLSRHWVLNKCC